MQKRLFLAIFLSAIVLLVHASLVSKTQKSSQLVGNKDVEIPQVVSEQSVVPSDQAPSQNAKYPQHFVNKDVTINPDAHLDVENITESTDQLLIELSPIGGYIASAKVLAYDTLLPQKNIGLFPKWKDKHFTVDSLTHYKTISYSNLGLELKKTFQLGDDPNIVKIIVSATNHSKNLINFDYRFNLGTVNVAEAKKNPINQRYYEISISLPNKIVRKNLFRYNPPAQEMDMSWVGLRDRYFCSVVKPSFGSARIDMVKTDETISFLLHPPVSSLTPGQTVSHEYLVYLGPQKSDLLQPMGSNCSEIINFGFFDTVAKMLHWVLASLFGVVENWGATIVIFSFCVFIVLSPLSIKSFKSMKRMQELQPAMEMIRNKYKDNPQKMNREIMEMYREKKVNPLSGCFPLLLQMPVFIALFQLLSRLVDLKGASFLWIQDLAEPDRLLIFPRSFPIIGNELNILPIFMVIVMVLQQKLTTPQSGSSDTAKQQKMMSLFMSVFFFFIFYKMPSSLVLYWSVNSFLMFMFQLKVIKPMRAG